MQTPARQSVPWRPFLLVCGLFSLTLVAAWLWAPDGWPARAIFAGLLLAYFVALARLGRRPGSRRAAHSD